MKLLEIKAITKKDEIKVIKFLTTWIQARFEGKLPEKIKFTSWFKHILTFKIVN